MKMELIEVKQFFLALVRQSNKCKIDVYRIRIIKSIQRIKEE